MLLQTTLSLAAAAAIINLWLSMRCGQVRMQEKILIGDGGNERLTARMRAHANFIENTPLVLVLIAGIELTGKGMPWVAYLGALFMLGRVSHGLGMDRNYPNPLRIFGTISAMVTLLVLAIYAVLIALGVA